MRRIWKILAAVWAVLMLLLAWHQVHFWRNPRFDNDILALLSGSGHDRAALQIGQQISDAGSRQVFVLVGAGTPEQALRAAQSYRDEIARNSYLRETNRLERWFDDAQRFYMPYRNRMLTDVQRENLQQADPATQIEKSLAGLYGLMGGARLTDWQRDPLGLWTGWWQGRVRDLHASIDASGTLQADGKYWQALRYETVGSAFSLDGVAHLQDALDSADAAARAQVPDIQILHAGVPLHAEAAAVRANQEMDVIGFGSLAAVLLFAWLVFRSITPMLVVGLSLVIGVTAALSVTVLIFGKIHVLTLVFGASLVGVAEDYGIHWFTSRQGKPASARWSILWHLLPSLLLALGTTVLAYLAMGVAPLQGLRQMALFSAVGLTAAFLTILCWAPWLDRGELRQTRFATWVGRTEKSWPVVRKSRAWMATFGVVTLLTVGGIWNLKSHDDLRGLQSSPASLVAQQRKISDLLGLPSPAQFYLVRGASAEDVLRQEEQLTAQLRIMRDRNYITGYRAITDWLPSEQMQTRNAALVDALEAAVVKGVADQTGEDLSPFQFSATPISLDDFLHDPVSVPFRALWSGNAQAGFSSVVMLTGIPSFSVLPELAAVAGQVPGVRWVDMVSDISGMLGHYRQIMTWLLVAGYIAVFAVLYWRLRNQAWLAIMPTAIGSLLTVAILGWMGVPFQLFNVLALLLILGMGSDFGIILTEHQGDDSAWVAICVGGASTWLSFGLLFLSATPALSVFGLTMLLGIGLTWVISPCFQTRNSHGGGEAAC